MLNQYSDNDDNILITITQTLDKYNQHIDKLNQMLLPMHIAESQTWQAENVASDTE